MTLFLNTRQAAIVREAYGGTLPPDLVVLPDHYEPLPEVYPSTVERCRKAAQDRQAAFTFLDTVSAGKRRLRA